MAGCGFQGKASGFLQDINHISWVHERFEAYLTAGSVRTAGFINASVTATDDVGGGIDSVAKTVDNLAIEFGLAWSKYVQTNDFGFCERRVAPNQYQHAIYLSSQPCPPPSPRLVQQENDSMHRRLSNKKWTRTFHYLICKTSANLVQIFKIRSVGKTRLKHFAVK